MSKIDLDNIEAILGSAVIENHKDELKRLEKDPSPITFSDRHERRMKKLFINAYRKKRIQIIQNIIRKITIAAACLIAIFATLLMFNSTVKAAVKEVVTEFFYSFANFRFNDDHKSGFAEWELGLISEEFSETHHVYNGSITELKYEDLDGNLIEFWAAPIRSSKINVDNKHSTFTIKNEEGIEYHIFTNTSFENPSAIIWISGSSNIDVDYESSYYHVENMEGIEYYIFNSASLNHPSTFIWINEGYCFALSGNCDIEILQKIASSFRKTIN